MFLKGNELYHAKRCLNELEQRNNSDMNSNPFIDVHTLNL
jgi:hypothetical protein